MSTTTLFWAMRQTVITRGAPRRRGPEKKLVTASPAASIMDKLMLIAIADEASEKTWDALIGVEDLAVFASCTLRAARESLRRLETAGYIRCRQTRVESGRSGWQRIYLLADESPLVQGLLDVDFSAVEEIRRFEMRTFRDRHENGYIPSDSPTTAKGEPGSAQSGRGNQVPGTRGNQVPAKGEPGSGYEGEPGSAPFLSAVKSSPSDAPEGEMDGSNSSNTNKTAETPAVTPDWAVSFVMGLDWGKHRRPTRKQAYELAERLNAALTTGLTRQELKRHVRATLNQATKSGVSYVLGGLLPDTLPVPQISDPTPECAIDVELDDDELDDESKLDQERAMLQIRTVLAETSRKKRTHYPAALHG